jgi:DNA-binding response OmpR family regulator
LEKALVLQAVIFGARAWRLVWYYLTYMADAVPSNKVLVVTSSQTLRALLELVIEEHGIEVQFHETAKEGLDYLKAHTPRAIVLDDAIEIDPFSIASRLKMSRRLREVPVVLLTTDGDERTKLTAEFARVDHVISKPVDRKAFSNILRHLPQQQPSA